MPQGKVKWFDEEKGYGFITPNGGSKDIFFHKTNIENLEKRLSNDELVEYEVAEGKKGPEAVTVKSVNS
jgi:cold shock protein